MEWCLGLVSVDFKRITLITVSCWEALFAFIAVTQQFVTSSFNIIPMSLLHPMCICTVNHSKTV